jgi:lysine 6-dehydrogenase
MKILVLGAAGAMASVVIRDLLKFSEDVRITAADARPMEWKDPRISAALADVRDVDSTTKLVDGHDAVLNCVTYYLNVPIMEACLRARVPYTDLGGLYHGTMKQFKLHRDFQEAGVTAVLGMGSTPGITNVMAGTLARQMDRVDELHVRIACTDESADGPLPIPYAFDTILDEFALEPMVFRAGYAEAVSPMSGSEIIEFPPPVGKAEAIYTLHSEVAMFPRSFAELQEASFKIAFPRDFVEKMRLLVQLGFASREKRIGDVSPRQMLLAVAQDLKQPEGEPSDCDVIRVIARGAQNGKPVERIAQSIILPDRETKTAAGSLDTGVPLSIVGEMLARKMIRTPGVLCPELAVPAEPFFEQLKRRNISAHFFPL